MGSREQNFYNALARRMGFDEAAQRVQDLYLDRKPRDAAAAVPLEFLDATSLVGPIERIRDRLVAYAEAGVTTLSITPTARTLEERLQRAPRPWPSALEAAGSRRVSSAIGYGDSIVLGVVEGLTEFLPVSSTGHLTIAESLLGKQTDNAAVTAFTVIIQFGAIVATFLYFRRDIVRLVAAWARGLFSAEARENPDYRFAWYVIAGSIPVVVAGVLLKPLITGPLRNLWVVAVAFVAWSVVMYVAEGRGRQKYGEEDLTLKAALIIGLVQCAALVPGRLPLGRDDLGGAAAGLQPGRGDTAVVLPGHPGADGGERVRAQGRRHLRRRLGPPDPRDAREFRRRVRRHRLAAAVRRAAPDHDLRLVPARGGRRAGAAPRRGHHQRDLTARRCTW